MRRKILSLVLALCMVISLLPMTAFAAENNTHTLTVNITGVEVDSATKYGTVSVAKGDNDSSPTEITDASGTVSITEGTDVKLIISIEAPTGYAVDTVKDGNDQALNANKDGNYVLENIDTADYSIAVTYKQVFDVTITAATDSAGNKVEADVDAAAKGETVTLTVTPVAGYEIETVKYTPADGSATDATKGNVDSETGATTYTFEMPEKAVTVSATFKAIDYTITVGTMTGGSVKATTPDSGEQNAATANKGDTVTLTVTPEPGKQIKTLTVKDSKDASVTVTPTVAVGTNSYTFTMPASNVTVAAEFEEITYTVTVSDITKGGTVTADKASAAKGATVTLTVKPDAGYKLKTLTLSSGTLTPTFSAEDPKNSYTFEMPEENVTVTAAFEAIPYGITVNSGDGTATITGNSVSDDAGSQTATVGNEITVEITAPSGKAVKSVTSADATVKIGATVKEGESENAVWKTTCTFTMPAKPVALAITYEEAGTNSVSIVNSTGGTVTASKTTANENDDVTLTIALDAGYKLTALTITGADNVTLDPAFDANNVATSYTFTMPAADVTVTPTFAKIAYTVTVPQSIDNGSVASDKQTATIGETVTLTVTPDTNYELGTLTIKDEAGNTIATTGSETTYTFTMPASNVNVTATFVEAGSETPDPGPNPGGNGGGSGGGSTTPTPPPEEPDPNPPSTGEDVTQTVTPDISEGTASATVDKETADKLVSDAVDNKSENVTVKVDVPADADVNEVKADIPASAVADLASKTDAALTVDTPVGNITIPNKTLAQLGGTSGNVTVTAAVNEDNSVKVEVQANGSTVGALNGGMKVDLPVSQPTAGTVAVLVDAEGNETILPKSAVDGSEVAVLLENGSATIKFVDNAQSFADTDNHWAKNSIAFVSSRNLFQGMENSSFKADVPMNRAMLVTVLHRLESTPAASGGSFDDVPSDSYYATAAAWAAGKGIVTGDDSGFSGDRSVTREEMAVMLYRYVQTINGNKGTLGSYSGMGGANDVSSWASEAMRWAVGSGIIGGDNSGNLNPGSTATRGEVSQMLMNFVKLITK